MAVSAVHFTLQNREGPSASTISSGPAATDGGATEEAVDITAVVGSGDDDDADAVASSLAFDAKARLSFDEFICAQWKIFVKGGKVSQ